MRGSWDSVLGLNIHIGARRRQGRMAEMGRGDHACSHGGIFPNTWRAAVWVRWLLVWAGFRAKFGHGPKTKFDLHGLLYIFY
jgi:hypothetical protein